MGLGFWGRGGGGWILGGGGSDDNSLDAQAGEGVT